jgi:hypothetical protein|tara:strand:- start:742 stop:969 length:228 start_codon:yes stop_codon:yes gene_type:complete
MTIIEHITYHEDNITRLLGDVERQTRMLMRPAASPNSLARSEDVLTIGQEISKLEIEIRICREIRSTLVNILAGG